MNILSVFAELLAQSGFAAITWQQCVMLLVSFVLLYLAIKKQFEPLLLLPIVLLVLYFAQRLLFRRLWDENLTVQISFDRDYIFCGEEANLVETIVNNKYLPLPVLEVGFDMSR